MAHTGLGGPCLPACASEFYKLTEAEQARVRGCGPTAGAFRLVDRANHGSSRIACELARTYQSRVSPPTWSGSRCRGTSQASGESDLLRLADASVRAGPDP